ncbi:MAG: hypothetical protein IJN69_08685 [Oscillospiraceae bacterium]|nr:hypothetical protein [Oscillospiraceae bacterium]
MKKKALYLLLLIFSFICLSGCAADKKSSEQQIITDLLNKWAAPQSDEVVADFYDGWDVIGDDSDNTAAKEDVDRALKDMYGEYFTDEGWIYFQSFMLPVTIAATENDFTISAENIAIEELTDGYDVTFDLKHYKGDDKDKAATVNSLSFRCYFKDGRICKTDFPNGMISPQFFVE